ncbi:MAG: biopolymer transporter ExbD [Deltaproteobacteria bacterium]|nr:biopolymer transporter ExbD [bacterium]MCB9476025.1 biopolymer transporter ExbD [Deltaproteobacteria bacterium]MCB9478286.1 biopolymer transporter ExbD [Deltaproteobacteria bacterium]MCB9487162.1 biopolymer transporter ExbD [Deltaproteobacteria bacterium]
MAGRPSQRLHQGKKTEDLNILPVMNVFMILVPFLLLSASFVQLTVVDTTLPATKTKTVESDSPTPTPPKLSLTVFVRDDGFLLAGYGGVLEPDGPAAEGEDAGPDRFIIKKIQKGVDADGKPLMSFDWDKLQEQLKKIKEAFPNHYSIVILPENTIRYETLVKLMDTTYNWYERTPDGEGGFTTETHELFPQPILAWSLSGGGGA